ncbi:MAG: hypothetical protein IPJ03_15175 [Ignavibacteriales bacterium]|nr:hypothetical protein [Ignavibacteriales bacterium]
MKSNRERAWEKAWEVRDFEIKLYWERAKYFWAFIAASFVAYFASLGTSIKTEFTELEFIIICIGYFFSLAWTLVNIGSKNWQKNWEGHIDRLEENFTGPLYRTVIDAKNYSVSKVNIQTSRFIMVIWILLCFRFLFSDEKFNWLVIILSLTITLVFTLILIISGRSGGNKKFNYKIRELK